MQIVILISLKDLQYYCNTQHQIQVSCSFLLVRWIGISEHIFKSLKTIFDNGEYVFLLLNLLVNKSNVSKSTSLSYTFLLFLWAINLSFPDNFGKTVIKSP